MLRVNHCSCLKLLKIEHILKLQETKLCHKLKHYKLPIYLPNLPLDQNSSIYNFNTCGQYNIHTQPGYNTNLRKKSIKYTLPHTINNASDLVKNKIYTRSLHGFATYVKYHYLHTYIALSTFRNCYICQYE